MKRNIVFKRFLLFFTVIWMLFFPIKGTVYQISLYIIPILVLSFSETRANLFKYKKELLILFVCLCLPSFISCMRAFFVYDTPITKRTFNIFWRLVLFPIALTVTCSYSGITTRRSRFILILVVLFYSVFAILNSYLDFNPSGKGSGFRDAGIISNPNPFGFLMACGMLIVIYNFWLTLNTRHRIFYFCSGIICFIGVVLSGSRSSWLGLIVAALFLLCTLIVSDYKFFVTRRNALKLICCSAVFLCLLLWFGYDSEIVQLSIERIEKVKEGDIRLEIWAHYLGFVSQHPIFGIPLQDSMKAVFGTASHSPHNMYLGTLVRTGSVGLMGLFFMFGYLVKKAFTISNIERLLPFSLLILLSIYCFFNSSMFGTVMTQGGFSLIVMLILSPSTILNKEKV